MSRTLCAALNFGHPNGKCAVKALSMISPAIVSRFL